MRGPSGFEAAEGTGWCMARSLVADHGPERSDRVPDAHEPCTRDEEAADRAGRKARAAVPTRGAPTPGLTRESAKEGSVAEALAEAYGDVLGREPVFKLAAKAPGPAEAEIIWRRTHTSKRNALVRRTGVLDLPGPHVTAV